MPEFADDSVFRARPGPDPCRFNDLTEARLCHDHWHRLCCTGSSMISATVCDARSAFACRWCIRMAMAVVLREGRASAHFAQIEVPPSS